MRVTLASLFAFLTLLLAGVAPASAAERPVFVLIHGGFGGGAGWKMVEQRLAKAGYRALAPDLPGQGGRAKEAGPQIRLSTYIDDIAALIERERLSRVVLVGHSLGGMVVAGVADRMPKRIAGQVYIDAFLPQNGESSFDLMPPGGGDMWRGRAKRGSGWDIPASNPANPPQPLATMADPVLLANAAGTANIPGLYVLTVEAGMTRDAFSNAADRARERLWPVHVLETGHLPQVTMPDALAAILTGFVQTIEETEPPVKPRR